MYGIDPTMRAHLAKLYVDERVRDADARRIVRAVRCETRAKNTTPARRRWWIRTRAVHTGGWLGETLVAERDHQ